MATHSSLMYFLQNLHYALSELCKSLPSNKVNLSQSYDYPPRILYVAVQLQIYIDPHEIYRPHCKYLLTIGRIDHYLIQMSVDVPGLVLIRLCLIFMAENIIQFIKGKRYFMLVLCRIAYSYWQLLTWHYAQMKVNQDGLFNLCYSILSRTAIGISLWINHFNLIFKIVNGEFVASFQLLFIFIIVSKWSFY